MLFYNIYSNISDEEFLVIQDKLIALEKVILDHLISDGWTLTMKVSENDALVIDLVKQGKIFYGNMGLNYEDQPSKQTFSFYVTKSLEGKKSFFYKDVIHEEKPIEFFENNIDVILQEALLIYNHWSEEFIITHGEEI